MKNKILLLIGLLFIVLLKVNSQQTVSDESKRYTIEIPFGWVYAVSKNVVVSVLICSDTINASERLNITDTKNPYNLEKAYKVNKDAFSGLKNFKIVQEGDGELGGQPSKWFIYTFTNKEGTVSMKGKQCTVKNSGRGFSIQYILKEARFDVVKETFEKAISTIKFK